MWRDGVDEDFDVINQIDGAVYCNIPIDAKAAFLVHYMTKFPLQREQIMEKYLSQVYHLLSRLSKPVMPCHIQMICTSMESKKT